MGDEFRRSDTETTAPLSEVDFLELQEMNNFNGISTMDSLIATPQNSDAAHTWGDADSLGSQPGPSQQVYLPESNVMVLRNDTLDSNTIFVNPNDVSNVVTDQNWQFGSDQQNIKSEEFYTQALPNGIDFQATNQIYSAANIPSPTSANPSTDSWPGYLNFNVSFQKLAANTKNKAWDFSNRLNKLFIDFNKHVLACFNVGPSPPDNLYVRVLPVYAVASFLQEPVKRCPNHAEPSDMSNTGFPADYRWHLIRVNHDGSIYEEDPVSKRLSVLVPLERPQGGTEHSSFSLKFMCLGSDVGGINRKPVKLVFTLEHGPSNVIGRCAVDVRICSCPKRDKQQEESRMEDEVKVKSLADDLARANSNIILTNPQNKKRKMEKDVEEMIMIPVAKVDFDKMNEFAEAAMVMRNLPHAQEIKAQRRRLLERHNPGLISKLKK